MRTPLFRIIDKGEIRKVSLSIIMEKSVNVIINFRVTAERVRRRDEEKIFKMVKNIENFRDLNIKINLMHDSRITERTTRIDRDFKISF